MRIFSISGFDQDRKLVIYNEDGLKEALYIGRAYIRCKKTDYKKYEEALKNDEEIESFANWLYENDIEHTSWGEKLVYKEDMQTADDEILYCEDSGVFDFNVLDFDLYFSYWDGHNYCDVAVRNEVNSEITEDSPGITKAFTFKGEYSESGNWRECNTGQYDIYKDDNDYWYIVYSSYYQGSLDYIEEVTLEQLKERFGESEFEKYED